jgi:hypothetical protein
VKFVTIELHGRKVILLSGARRVRKTEDNVYIEAHDNLLDAARENPDAVAFGYVSGRWVAAA